MKNIVFLICSVLLLSCSSIQKNESSRPQLEILEKYPLPSIPQNVYEPDLKISALMLINQDGSVIDAKLLSSSGNDSWDSEVIASLKKWRYAPVRSTMWIQQDIQVKIGNPYYLSLSEILCATIEDANLVYDALKEGEDFGDLALKYSIDPSKEKGGKLDEVDIHLFPEYIQKEIIKLGAGEYSQPIRYGEKYIIIKKDDV